MRAVAVTFALAACGRLDFAAHSDSSVISDAGSDAPITYAQFQIDLAAGPAWIRSLAKLPDGAIVVGGYYSGATSFGTAVLPYVAGEDMLLAVVDPTGAVRWAHGFGSIGSDEVRGVAVAADGTIYATGLIGGAVSVGGPQLPSAGAFIAAFTAAGDYLWSRSYGATSDHGIGIVATRDGDVAVAGGVSGTVDFGDGVGTPPTSAARDMFVARYSSGGALRWAHRWGSAGVNALADIDEDAAGNLYACGSFAGAVDFGGGLVTYYGSQDAVVLSLDAGGGFRWNRTFGGADYERARTLAVVDQTVLVGGYYNTTIDLAVPPSMDGDALLVSYATDGTPGQLLVFGNAGCDSIERVRAIPGGFRIAGRFNGTIAVGMSLSSTGGADGLVFSRGPGGATSAVSTYAGTLGIDDVASAVIGETIVAGYLDEPTTPANCVTTGSGTGELVAAHGFLRSM